MSIEVYAAQPREGTETRDKVVLRILKNSRRFMQLNPARGRKLGNKQRAKRQAPRGLCSSTPRGDGNSLLASLSWAFSSSTVYAAQPREGTETVTKRLGIVPIVSAVYAAQPREGTET